MKRYDLLVLGGGSAGYHAARVAAELGKRVAIVDGARELGGLCILRGCMPSKTLLHAVGVLHQAKHAAAFGVRVSGASLDMAKLRRWKRKLIREFVEERVEALESGKYDLYRSYGRFTGPHSVVLDDGRELRASHVLISTGSRPRVPDVPGLAETPSWTSDEALDLGEVPESVIVLGGGPVGCELAQFLRRAGSRVVLLQRGKRLLKGHAPESATIVEGCLRNEGIGVWTDTRIEKISATGKGVSVRFRHDGKVLTRRAAHLLNALGREPAVAGLDLQAAGVKLTPDGRVAVNGWQQTSAKHIYAAGDVCCPDAIVHIAVAQGELVARHAFARKTAKRPDPGLHLAITFTDPPVATLGRSEEDLRKEGIPHLSACHPFDDHGKAMLMGATTGNVKILAEPERGRILGAEIVGLQADSLIHCLTGPMAMKATVHDLLKAPWYHPTLAEILTYPLESIAARLEP